MASSFTLAIDALIRERDYKFVSQVATDYNLNADELYEKYNLVSGKPAPAPVKKRKAVVEAFDAEGQPINKKAKGACQGITSKKEPCKFSALKGGCFCKRHQKAHEEEEEAKKSGIVVPVKKLKVPKEPKAKPTEPVHNHPVDSVVHEECDLCQSHGPVFDGIFEAEEVVVPVEDRLKMVIDGADEPGPDPSETRDGPLEEEEFSDAEFPSYY